MNQPEKEIIVFKEKQTMVGQGENFLAPIIFQGGVIYFGSLEKVVVPEALQAELSGRLQHAIDAGSFPETTSGDTSEGKVMVPDGDIERVFRIVLSFQKNDRDDYFLVESIQEQSR